MIERYLESKKYAWSPTTVKTVRSKLKSMSHLFGKAPNVVYETLRKKYSPYSTKQYLLILGGFDEFNTKGINRYGNFVKENRRLFKSVYVSRQVNQSYSEVLGKLSNIRDRGVQSTCHFLLRSGLRLSEAYSASRTVTGKGNKTRRVYTDVPKKLADRTKVRAALKELGLTPHDLRKLCATRLVEKGASPQDLCTIMGWTSIETAYRYLQPSADSKLKELMK